MTASEDQPLKAKAKTVARAAIFQVAGRLSMSGIRLLIAVLIIRYLGVEGYGEYSLVMSFLFVAEWLVDFGTTDIGVRDSSQARSTDALLIGAAHVVTILQALAAFIVLMVSLIILGYPPEIFRAGIVGAIGLIFYAGIVVYRINFRVAMRMADDITAELVGFAVLVPLIVASCLLDASIEVLVACYLAGRVAHFLTAFVLAKRAFGRKPFLFARDAALRMFLRAVPLGITGLLVSLHDNMIPIVLSKLADLNAVAEYSYAIRFALPAIIAIQALNVAFFPMLSSSFHKDRDAFSRYQQHALESSVVIGAAIFCFLNASAEFILGFAGTELAHAALVFRLMAWAVLLRVVTMPISPLIIVAGGQTAVLWITVLSVALQFVALAWLVPAYGAVGAVVAYLIVKLAVGTVPIVTISTRLTKCPLQWRRAVTAIVSAIVSTGICSYLFGLGTIWVGFASVAIYFVLALITGAYSLRQAQFLFSALKRESA